jgi:PmbA protein
MARPVDIPALMDDLERRLKGRGFEAYEICIGASRTLSVEVRDGAVDSFRVAAPSGTSIRILADGRLGFSYSTSFDDADLERMIANAEAGARYQTADSANTLPEPSPYPSVGPLRDPELDSITTERKIQVALDLERIVLGTDDRIRRVRKASYGESLFTVALRNSRGVAGSYDATSVSCSVSAVAEEGSDAQMGWDFNSGHFFQQLDPEAVAAGAARNALRLLGAAPVPTMSCPAILDPYVATEMLEVLAPAFLAESVLKGKSLLAGRQGESIASPLVRIVDDGTLQNGLATTPFDAEGVPHRRTTLVADGKLMGYLYDSYHGVRMDHPSTGNSVRGGVKGLPQMGVTNFFLEQGTTSRESLLAGIGRGIMIVDVMGMHTANPVSGDFSVGASGILIEGGRLTVPVKGIAISGNILDLFARVEGVGDDLRFFGAVGSPSLRLSCLDVSGK